MFLHPRLKDLNSRSRSTSPFPFIRQPHGYSGLIGQDANNISRSVEGENNQCESGSSRTCPSAGNSRSVGSWPWDMPMVSICFVCDMMLRHGLQEESSIDSGRRSSQQFSDEPVTSNYLFHGSSFQNTSDGSVSSHYSSHGSLFIDKELYELRLYTKELKQKNARLETQCTTLQYVSSISHTRHISGGHRQAYDSLLDALQTHKSQISPCSTDVTPLVHSDYPNIKFWNKQEWTVYCSNNATSTTDKT